MKVVVYAPTEPGFDFVSRLHVGRGFVPIIFSSSTEEGARTKAQEHWDKARATVAKRKPSAAADDVAADLEARHGKLQLTKVNDTTDSVDSILESVLG